MRPALFQILSRAFWLLIILVSTGTCIASLRQERRLKWPTIYLGYCAAAGSIQFIIWLYNATTNATNYSPEVLFWFWLFELINTIAIFAVALELVDVMFSKFAPVILISGVVMVVSLTLSLSKPVNTTTNLEVNLDALLVVGLVLTSFVFPHKEWTRESKLIFWGLISLVVLSSISSWLWVKHLLGIAGVFFSQLSPLPGLLCFAFAHEKTKMDSGPPLEIGFIYPDEVPKFENKLNKKPRHFSTTSSPLS